MKIDALNELFESLSPTQRLEQLYDHFPEEEVLLTSSFGTNSALLLHMISRFRPTQAVHFIDTTYHFSETLRYKHELARKWNLKVVDVRPDRHLNAYTRERQSWEQEADLCCAVNKVAPLDEVKASHKVWISGLMAAQTRFRSGLKVFEPQGELLKFHPLIDLTEEDALRYRSFYRLPAHPLQAKGYGSVGCVHCTQRGEGRSGRWKGQAKMECGLHTQASAALPVLKG